MVAKQFYYWIIMNWHIVVKYYFFFSCVTRLYPPHFTHICNLFHKIFRFFAKFNDNLVHVD